MDLGKSQPLCAIVARPISFQTVKKHSKFDKFSDPFSNDDLNPENHLFLIFKFSLLF